MKIDLFNELQSPRPWAPNHEWNLMKQTLAQAKLADEVGFDTWWQVEHHTVEEFTYSSAPEVILSAIAQQTSRLRIGHAVVLLPFNFNHPIRLAERAATLDLLSDGRLEFGMGRSTALEWWVFGIDPEETPGQADEATRMIPKMWTEEKFSWKGDYFDITERPIIPKPYQKPHPPLWRAGTSPDSIVRTARYGMGVMGSSLANSIENVSRWIDTYRDNVKDAEPVGSFVNNQTAVFTFVHCAETTKQAIENGAPEAVAWYLSHFRLFTDVPTGAPATGEQAVAGRYLHSSSTTEPGQLTVGEEVAQRIRAGEEVSGEEIFETMAEEDMVIIGDPETCRRKIQRYQEIGVDHLLCFSQVGRLSHQAVMDNHRAFGRHIIPYFSPK